MRTARQTRRPKRSRSGWLIALATAINAGAALGAGIDGGCAKPAAMVGFASLTGPHSVTLTDGRVLRLAGIDSFALLTERPEMSEAALRDGLAALLAGSVLHAALVAETRDRYGRLAALLWAGDGLVQVDLARNGLAVAFAQGEPLPCFAEILAAEDEARRAGRGFWQEQHVRSARPETLEARKGRFAIVEDTVISVGNRPGRSYLNFGRSWAKDFTVEIAARHRERFGGEAGLAAWAGSRIRVRGFLDERNGPMIVARSPMQIEALGQPAADHGKAP